MNFLSSIRSWLMPAAPASMFPMLSGTTTMSYMDADTALQHTPVWRAVNLIANDVARTEFDTDSKLLQGKPNSTHSSFTFWQSMMFGVLLHGNSFALIQRNGFGDAVELWPIDPYRVSLVLDKAGIFYRIKDIGDIPAQDMLHLKFGSVGGVWGESPIKMNKTVITLGVAQENYLLATSTNGGGAQMVISHPKNIGEAARRNIAEEYRLNHAGASNAGKPMVIGEDAKVFTVNSSISDPGLAGARERSIEDVSRIYGVPSSLLGQVGSAVYGSLEALNRGYLDFCLQHWFAAISAECLDKLNATMTYDLDLFIQPPLAELMAALRTGIESGVLTRNEARDYLDLEPVAGGDTFNMALNLGTGGGQTNIGTDTSGTVSEGDNSMKGT